MQFNSVYKQLNINYCHFEGGKKSNSRSQCQVGNRCKPPVHCGGGRGRDHPEDRKERVLRLIDGGGGREGKIGMNGGQIYAK